MRIIFLFPILFIFILNSYGQVTISEVSKISYEIGKVNSVGVYATLNRTIYSGKDTLYTLCIRDQTYKELVSTECAAFKASIKDLQDIYLAFKACFSKENRSNKDFQMNLTLGDKSVRVSPVPNAVFGGMYLYIGSAYTTLSEKNLDKLFDKR